MVAGIESAALAVGFLLGAVWVLRTVRPLFGNAVVGLLNPVYSASSRSSTSATTS